MRRICHAQKMPCTEDVMRRRCHAQKMPCERCVLYGLKLSAQRQHFTFSSNYLSHREH
jgi:endonuclease III